MTLKPNSPYLRHVEALKGMNREERYRAWSWVKSPVFVFCCKDKTLPSSTVSPRCGCPTMVAVNNHYIAETEELTALLRADERLKAIDTHNLTDSDIDYLAEWQERIDEMLGREPPE